MHVSVSCYCLHTGKVKLSTGKRDYYTRNGALMYTLQPLPADVPYAAVEPDSLKGFLYTEF